MINFGIFRKTLRDSLPSVLAVLIGVIGFVILIVWGMLTMGTELLSLVSKFSFLEKIFEISLGIRVDGDVSLNILFAICFTHLAVFILCWSVLIATTTRVTVGEIERGTADLLLTMPVSRSEVYFTTTLVWLLIAVLVSFVPLVGIWISLMMFETDEVVYLWTFVPAASNFACLNVAIGGISMLAGCVFARRGMAISFVVGVIFVSVGLNFIEPFVGGDNSPIPNVNVEGNDADAAAEDNVGLGAIAYFSLMKYYRPVDVVRFQVWPIGHMLLLLAIGAVCWCVGWAIYRSKDVPTA